MIYYDHTEGRARSKLPKAIQEVGVKLTGLEALTGSDLLITPLKKPPLPKRINPKSAAHRRRIKRHAEAGCLVQRATGRDFLSHIKNGLHILARMLEWSPCCVLLSVGSYGRGRGGKTTLAGKTTNWPYSALQGLVWSWQAGGGIYVNLAHGGALAEWIGKTSERLADRLANPEKELFLRQPVRPVVGAHEVDEATGYPIGRARAMLMQAENIGEKGADALLREFGTLGMVFTVLTSDWILADRMLPKGIGPKTIRSFRKLIGEDCRLELAGMFEPGFPVTVRWPPGFEAATVGAEGRGWVRLGDGSVEATYFTESQLMGAFPKHKPSNVQFGKLLDHVVPSRRGGEKEIRVVNGETVVMTRDTRTGGWVCWQGGRLLKWDWENKEWKEAKKET